MSGKSSSHYGLSRLLRETFAELDLHESTCLVGILYESQILFMGATWVLPALEPDEAAALIADLYDQSAIRLLQRFRSNWRSLKRTTVASEMIEKLRAMSSSMKSSRTTQMDCALSAVSQWRRYGQ